MNLSPTFKISLITVTRDINWFKKDATNLITHRTVTEYDGIGKSDIHEALKDLMDAIDVPLTEEDIRNDFGSRDASKLTNDQIARLLKYYNGRKAIFDKILADIQKYLNSGMTQSIMFVEEIPAELETFSIEEDQMPEILASQVEVSLRFDH